MWLAVVTAQQHNLNSLAIFHEGLLSAMIALGRIKLLLGLGIGSFPGVDGLVDVDALVWLGFGGI